MYKAFTAQELRKMFKLPDGYTIEGFLSYGACDRLKHDLNIQNALKELGIDFTINKPEGFLQYITEININDKKYWFTMMYGSALLSEFVHLALIVVLR